MSHPGPRRRRRPGHEEAHENHERWLITYADMITLLMVLFIVLFAISQVDQKKFAALKVGLANGFAAPVSVLSGADRVLQDNSIVPPMLSLAGAAPGSQRGQAPPQPVPSPPSQPSQQARLQERLAQAEKEVANLEAIRQAMVAALAGKALQDAVQFRLDERGLVVSIVTDQVLFPADLAELQPFGRMVLDTVAPVLRRIPNDVVVEGYTNTVPVKPKYYPTEWELSTARAVTVLRYLIDAQGLAPQRMSAAGYADQHPLVPPSDPRSVRLNRRVQIVVVSTLPADVRALLPQVAPSLTGP